MPMFSAGIENIAYDSVTGFNSPMFIRTVKLKDFPWNGWLALGLDAAPKAAWNPIAGFTDPFGRLMWFAVGDPAVIPSPYDRHGCSTASRTLSRARNNDADRCVSEQGSPRASSGACLRFRCPDAGPCRLPA